MRLLYGYMYNNQGWDQQLYKTVVNIQFSK